jgi:putative spermidine/putrescine transport system permease protein
MSAGMRSPGQIALRLLILLLMVFFLAPLVVVVYLAFSPVGFFQFPPKGFSLQWFDRLWDTPDLLNGLYRSLVLAVVIVPVTGALAIASALAMKRATFRGKNLLDSIFVAPIIVPSLVIGVALLQLYGALRLNDTYLGVFLAHIVITFPYFLRSVYVSLATRDAYLEDAAESLGAGPWRLFRTITFPSIRPGVISGAIFAFVISLDEFSVTLFIVGRHTQTAPVAIYNYWFDNANPTVAALSVFIIIIGFFAAWLANKTVSLDRMLMQ